jgi:hybrid cluster-associated redox disulfide protein
MNTISCVVVVVGKKNLGKSHGKSTRKRAAKKSKKALQTSNKALKKSVSSLNLSALKVVIKKTDSLGDIVSNFPEVAPVLTQAGLHCIGCQVSAYESLEQGCSAHGMKTKQIDELVVKMNEKIAEFEKMPKVVFTDDAVLELAKRVNGKKYVRIIHSFMGEFDFEATDEKLESDVVFDVYAKGEVASVSVIADSKIEKMLRGIRINYDRKEKDFAATRV